MTETYSVENYLVTEEILEEFLRDEFPCHAKPDLRKRIIKLFSNDYAKFLQITASVNKRLYIARLVPVTLTKRIPKNLRSLVTVCVGNVNAVATPSEEIIVYEREPTIDETIGLAEAFGQLEPRLRFRGKFAFEFFRKWLNDLADKYEGGDPSVFGENKPEGVIRRAEFVLSNFASKSRIPTGLPGFIDAIA